MQIHPLQPIGREMAHARSLLRGPESAFRGRAAWGTNVPGESRGREATHGPSTGCGSPPRHAKLDPAPTGPGGGSARRHAGLDPAPIRPRPRHVMPDLIRHPRGPYVGRRDVMPDSIRRLRAPDVGRRHVMPDLIRHPRGPYVGRRHVMPDLIRRPVGWRRWVLNQVQDDVIGPHAGPDPLRSHKPVLQDLCSCKRVRRSSAAHWRRHCEASAPKQSPAPRWGLPRAADGPRNDG